MTVYLRIFFSPTHSVIVRTCMRICVCEKKRENEEERERERERKRKRERRVRGGEKRMDR